LARPNNSLFTSSIGRGANEFAILDPPSSINKTL
jgi:hypothetical protein